MGSGGWVLVECVEWCLGGGYWWWGDGFWGCGDWVFVGIVVLVSVDAKGVGVSRAELVGE